MTNRTKSEFTSSHCRVAAKTNFLMLLLFPARFAHVRYSSRMIDRFLNWGDHGKPKSRKIKGRCQPPLHRTYRKTPACLKFGNHVTVHRPTARPSVRTTGIPMFTLTLSSYFLSPLIAHQCCDQLTAVKTRYLLTSITWPYRGLRCRPIQVEVIRCQVTSFQMIAGSFF